ncbi:NADH-quinone oxidoreductase subunit NuoH [bacterium]|nr:NADH-quinone oxidoreductase subunit NuoH [bacterium]
MGQFVGGPQNALIIVGAIIKILAAIGSVMGAVPFIVLAERKVIGYVQDRPGPNRAGPWGIVQGIVDGLKLLVKEDFIPGGADRVLYLLGPTLVTIPAFLAMCIIPFGPIIEGQALLDWLTLWGLQGLYTPSSQLALAITNPNIGILYVFAITSVGVYGITLAGWSSENKWSLLGGIRASAQMISYELSLSLSIIGVLLIAGDLNLYSILDSQSGWFWHWNVFAQPVAFLLFLTSMFAETNRLPFDLAEGESELTGGFHTEYSSMKFALFFMSEYINMVTVAAVCTTLFLGGYFLVPESWAVGAFDWVYAAIADGAGMTLPSTLGVITASLLAPMGLAIKLAGFIFFYIFVRACWPRFRYDQVMNLGWKVLLPVGLINLVVTAVGVAIISGIAGQSAAAAGASQSEIQAAITEGIKNYKILIGVVTFGLLVVVEVIVTARRRKMLKRDYRNVYYEKQPARKARAVPT